MKSENLIEVLKKINTGICEVCKSPKGHFGIGEKYFCYKRNGYELLDYEESKKIILRRKRRLREEFKKIAIKSDIFYCLKVFLSLGELQYIKNFGDRSIIPDSINRKSIIKIDPRSIAITNLAVKWLLEDSLEHLKEIVEYNNTYCVNMLNLLITWLEWNKKEKLMDKRYHFGFLVSKNNNKPSFIEFERNYKFIIINLSYNLLYVFYNDCTFEFKNTIIFSLLYFILKEVSFI